MTAPTNEAMNEQEISAAVATLSGWEWTDGRLHSTFGFDNFVESIGFMVRVAVWAEKLDHHPDWSNLYNTVDVWLETHDVGGISPLDVQLASKMNELAGRSAAAADHL